jgi:hypothetical protein
LDHSVHLGDWEDPCPVNFCAPRFAEEGDPPGSPKLGLAVAEFVARGAFQFRRRYETGPGMSILERTS